MQFSLPLPFSWIRKNRDTAYDNRSIAELMSYLDDNDKKIMVLVSLFNILTRFHIQVLLYNRFLKSKRLANSRLQKLYNLGLIDLARPPYKNSLQHTMLTKKGVAVLRNLYPDKVIYKTLSSSYQHTLAVADFYIALVEAAKENNMNINWQLEPVERYKGSERYRADAFFQVETQDEIWLYYLEVDLGTETIPTLNKKMRRLHQWLNSKAHARKPWAPAMPIALITVPNEERRTKFVELLKKYELAGAVALQSSLFEMLFCPEDKHKRKRLIGIKSNLFMPEIWVTVNAQEIFPKI